MLTDQDIKKLIDAHKEVFPTKVDFDELRRDFSILQTSVDGFAKKVTRHDEEIIIINHRLKKLENPA